MSGVPSFSQPPSGGRTAAATLAVLRGCVLAIFVLGSAGIGTELFLIGHTEDAWQWIPIVLLGSSVLVLGWHAAVPGRGALRVFQGVMALFLASGALGAILHYRGNAEFEREMVPAIAGWVLFREAMTGATPALAPGTMIWLGLLGWAWTFRHPRLARPAQPAPTPTHRTDP